MEIEEPILLILHDLVHVICIIKLIIQNMLHSEQIEEVEQLEVGLVLDRSGGADEDSTGFGLRLLCSLAERVIDFNQILDLAFIVAVISVAARGHECSGLLGGLERIVLVVKLLDYSLLAFELVETELDPILLIDCEDFVNVDEIRQIYHIDQAHVLIWSKCLSVGAQKALEQIK